MQPVTGYSVLRYSIRATYANALAVPCPRPTPGAGECSDQGTCIHPLQGVPQPALNRVCYCNAGLGDYGCQTPVTSLSTRVNPYVVGLAAFMALWFASSLGRYLAKRYGWGPFTRSDPWANPESTAALNGQATDHQPSQAVPSLVTLDMNPEAPMGRTGLPAVPTGADPLSGSPTQAADLELVLVTPLTPVIPGINLELGDGEVQLTPKTLGRGAFGRVVVGVYGGQQVAVKLANAGLMLAPAAAGSKAAALLIPAQVQAPRTWNAEGSSGLSDDIERCINSVLAGSGGGADGGATTHADVAATSARSAHQHHTPEDTSGRSSRCSSDVGSDGASRCPVVPAALELQLEGEATTATHSRRRKGDGCHYHYHYSDGLTNRSPENLTEYVGYAKPVGGPTASNTVVSAAAGRQDVASSNSSGAVPGGGKPDAGAAAACVNTADRQAFGHEVAAAASPNESRAGVKEAASSTAGCQSAAPSNCPGGASSAGRAFGYEVAVLARCQHPNIVRLLAASLEPPRLCLVMELMDTSLDRVLHGGTTAQPAGNGEGPPPLLTLPKVLHIATQIAKALSYLHPTVLHRDLKPANVLLTNPDNERPVAKLADFGLSRLGNTVLVTGHPEVGTAPYMAPEVFDPSTYIVTDRTDVYGFGVILWEMLSGRVPWEGVSMVQIACAIALRQQRLPLSAIEPARLPPKLAALITACWDPDPVRRPAAAEVVKTLALVQQALTRQLGCG